MADFITAVTCVLSSLFELVGVLYRRLVPRRENQQRNDMTIKL